MDFIVISGGGYNGLSNLQKRKDFANELKIEAGNTLILSVGELNENKNHSTVIRAVARLGNSSIHYVIAGQGRLKKELEELAKELGIAEQVHLLGYRSDIVDVMKVADIYCLPSLREGLNVSLMEAMASGLPCIVSDIRGNRDLFGKNDKKNLLLPEEPEQWAKEIQNRIGDLWNETGNAREKSRNMRAYSEAVVIEKMKEIYRCF